MLRLVSSLPLTKRVLRALAQRPGVPLHYQFIATQLGHASPDKVRLACWRLARQGRLFSYSDGVYGLPGKPTQRGGRP